MAAFDDVKLQRIAVEVELPEDCIAWCVVVCVPCTTAPATDPPLGVDLALGSAGFGLRHPRSSVSFRATLRRQLTLFWALTWPWVRRAPASVTLVAVCHVELFGNKVVRSGVTNLVGR